MKHNRVTIGDLIATKHNIGTVTKVTWSGGEKKLHVKSMTGKVFPIRDNDIKRLIKKR